MIKNIYKTESNIYYMFRKREKKEKEGKESRVKGDALGVAGFTLAITSISIILLGTFGIMIMPFLGFIFCLIQQKKRPTRIGRIGLIISLISFVFVLVYVFYLGPLLLKYLQSLNPNFPAA
jgi:hypothetical protein